MLRYRLGMRSWPRSVVVLRIRAGGPPFVVYRMERAGRPEPEHIGYWTSIRAGRAVDLCRRIGWVVLGVRPGTYHAVSPEPLVRRSAPPPPGAPGSGVREPLRPVRPSLSGAAALPFPGDE